MTSFLLLCLNCHVSSICPFLLYSESPDMLQLVRRDRGGGAKVKHKNNLQGDRSFNDLINMLFLVSSLAQITIE